MHIRHAESGRARDISSVFTDYGKLFWLFLVDKAVFGAEPGIISSP